MSLYEIWKENPAQIREKRVDQIIGFAGDGKLGDNNSAPAEFRAFLARVPSEVLAGYADDCLSRSFTDSGLALQDIVNEIAGRLGFLVEPGRYRGTKNAIGHDGIWTGPDGHAVVPSSRLNPSSPATFPWTSMIRRAFSSSFSRRVFSRSSLRTFPSSGFRSLGFRPRLFDSALSDPLRTALRHVVRCDEYKPSRRSSCPTSPGSVHRPASSTIRSLHYGANRRRSGRSTTSGSAGAAAFRLASPDPAALPFSLGVSASSVSLPSPYSNSLLVPCLT